MDDRAPSAQPLVALRVRPGGGRTPGTSRTDQQVGTRPLHTPKQIIRKLRRVSA